MSKSDVTLKSDSFARVTSILAFAALAVGALLRLSGLDDHTVDHNEIYVPGIRLPSGMSIPESRMTFSTIITSTIVIECHPPGYYLAMLPWTRFFGTSPLALRLPSVIIDIMTILLIYVLGARLGLRKAGVLGCWLWATAGAPIYLAQEARLYPLACFLGVLATILLVESYRGDLRHQRFITGAYVLVMLAGLSVSHFFWPILLTHMLYAQFGPTRSVDGASPQLRWQLFVLALASPLLAIAAFQSGRPSYLSPDIWASVLAFLRILCVWHGTEVRRVIPWLSGAASIACILLLVVGVLRTRGKTLDVNSSAAGCPKWLLYAVVTLAFVSIEAFAWITHRRQAEFTWLAPRTGSIVVCGAVPLLVLVADLVVRRGCLSRWLALRAGAPFGLVWLVILLAVVPVGLLALISVFVPLLADRTISLFAPYLMLIVGAGAVRLCRSRIARGTAVGFLILLNTTASLGYRELPHSPTDYATLAARVAPKVQVGDLWFIFRHWATTPIFYYFDPDQYTFVAHDHAQILSEQPNARVWVLGFEDLPAPPKVTNPLKGRHRLVRVEASGIYADLYAPVLDEAVERTNQDTSESGSHEGGLISSNRAD